MTTLRLVLAFLFALSLLSFTVAVGAWRRSGRGVTTTALECLEDAVLQVEHRAAELDRGARGLAGRVGSLESRTAGPRDRGPEAARDGTLASLAERMDQLEARLEAVMAPAPVAPSPPADAMDEVREAPVGENQALAADRARPAPERVRALRALRPGGDGVDDRTREVVRAMIELFQDPRTEGAVRTDVIRNLDGVLFPELKEPLLAIVESEFEPATRAEAIEVLQPFYDDPAVHAAIARVRDDDKEDLRVRHEALRRLTQYEERRQAREPAGE